MLKFKGSPANLIDFVGGLIKEYGDITLKELFIILEKERLESEFPCE